MVASMYSSDTTSTTPTTHYSDDTSTYVTNYRYEKVEAKPIDDDRDWCKEGWFNPKKMGLPIRPMYAKIRIQIRNHLK